MLNATIKFDSNELMTLFNECEKDTDELMKVLDEYSNKYPFLKLEANISLKEDSFKSMVKSLFIKGVSIVKKL
jgi:hypothetical protein